MVGRQDYLPYGGPRGVAVSLPTDRAFTGQVRDATGLDYFRARYFSSSLGQFISADSIVPGAGNPQAFNRYAFVLNNPLRYTDPSGHCPFCLVVAGVIIILKVVDYGWTAYDAWQAGSTLADPNASQTEKDAAALSLAMTVAFEASEPDDISPVSLPLDDLARKGFLKQLPLPGMEDLAPKTWPTRLKDLPIQAHHILTNKYPTKWTPEFEKIIKPYGLDLDGAWNKIDIPHPQTGGHPEKYHKWLLEQLRAIDEIAKGDQQRFLELYNERIRQQVQDHPEMLLEEWWK